MAQTFRTTQYRLNDDAGGFSGTTFTLTLQQDLVADYFLIIQNSGTWDGSTNSGPHECMMGVTDDPFGTGDLGTTAGADELSFARGDATGNWTGVITVVECLTDQDDGGFRLRHVASHTIAASTTTDSSNMPGASEWTDIDQVALYGGDKGGGVGTGSSGSTTFPVVYARIFPQNGATDTIEYRRDLTGGGSAAATFVTYVVEWGSEWTIQRVNLAADPANGGNGVDATGEYNTATITSVNRDETFVTANGMVSDNGIGDGWSGYVVTLGDGVTQNATETKVAIASEFSGDAVDAEVYIHSHANVAVDYRFGTDGATGIISSATTATMVVDTKLGAESYGTTSSWLEYTNGVRWAYWTDSCGATGTAFPRPLASGMHTGSGTVQWERQRAGTAGAVWLQSIDFNGIVNAITVAPGGAASFTASATTPAIELARSVSPGSSASGSLSATTPAIERARSVSPSAAASAALSGVSPAIGLARTVSPGGTAGASVSGVQPAVVLKRTVSPGSAAGATVSGVDPVVGLKRQVSPSGPAELTSAAISPAVVRERTVSPSGSATMAVSATSPAVTRSRTVSPSGAAGAAVTAVTPTIELALQVSPGGAATFTLSALVPLVVRERLVQPGGSAAAVGSAVTPNIERKRNIDVPAADAAITAITPGVVRTRTVSPAGAATMTASLIQPDTRTGGKTHYMMPATLSLSIPEGWSIGPRDVVEVPVERVKLLEFREDHLGSVEVGALLATALQFSEAILTQAAIAATLSTLIDRTVER